MKIVLTTNLLIYFIAALLCSCDNKKQTADQELAGSESAFPNKLDSILVEKDYQDGEVYAEPDHFRNKIDSVSPSLSKWGFIQEDEQSLNNQAAFNKHWWLKIFQRKRNSDTTNFPLAKDLSSIKTIRQFTFKKTWKFVIEEWQLENGHAARKWLKIAISTKSLDNVKPPRVYWIEGDKMYFIMATAAVDWLEHGDELVELFSGRKRSFISLFNQPLDVTKYKRKQGGANSGGASQRPYLYRPDTVGTYYNYFFFHKLRVRFIEESFRGLNVRTYIHGKEIGWYEKVIEEFIAIKSKLPDPLLGHLNLVGKDRNYLLDYLGNHYIAMKDIMVYQHNGDILILHLKDKKVDWFNCIRTTLKLESGGDLPEELKYFEERVPK